MDLHLLIQNLDLYNFYLESNLNLDRSHMCLSSIKFTENLDIAGFYSKDLHWRSHVHEGLDSRNPGPQNDFDR